MCACRVFLFVHQESFFPGVQKDVPLCMRTHSESRHCLAVVALGASVREVHTFGENAGKACICVFILKKTLN